MYCVKKLTIKIDTNMRYRKRNTIVKTHSAMNFRPATGHTIRRMTVKSRVQGRESSICSLPRTRQTIMRFDLRCLSKVCSYMYVIPIIKNEQKIMYTCIKGIIKHLTFKSVYLQNQFVSISVTLSKERMLRSWSTYR